jgi:hypothetical protein
MVFFDEPLAVNIGQLRERCERLPAVRYADWETVGIGLRRGREGKRQERVLVALFKSDDGAGEFAALAVGLTSDIFSQSDPPDFAFTKIKPRGLLRMAARHWHWRDCVGLQPVPAMLAALPKNGDVPPRLERC